MARIADLVGDQPTLSFEFFPPADEVAAKQLAETLDELSGLAPSFVSVTCGVGGDGHDRTRDIVTGICQDRPFPAMAHLTCVGHTREGVAALLDDYAAAGVVNILALAGDPPDGSAISGDFRYASELVEVVRDHPANFSIGVAAHPEVHPRSTDRASDRQFLADKLNQADFAITQFFFDPSDYVRLCDELADLGCNRPVIPGVMPVIWPKSIRRFAKVNGSTVPEALFAELAALSGPDRITAAAETAAELSQQLLDAGAHGIHLYTLNRPQASTQISNLLDL
ncbi:MAG: methylenetetrahydrofolate reductase [Acidimicrobiia bacterium]|nr:methylenetetrahydrofolate reductase [Acidimicrobiia bacterium]MCY4433914.1 methylenetetrahydrofolate reductase [bacterium]